MNDHRRRLWRGPEWKNDPEASADRTAVGSGPMDESEIHAVAARHWRRSADRAAKWHAANPRADAEERDRAFSHRVGAEGNAEWFEAGVSQNSAGTPAKVCDTRCPNF